MKHNMYTQPFNMEVNWPKIWCLKEVSTMFYKFAHTASLLCGADVKHQECYKA